MSIFNSIITKKPKKSVFNLSHNVKMTASMGKLYPILCEPVLPGDKWRMNTELHCRLAPMLAPVMSRIDISVHYFFVPNRLIWTDFQKFITGGEDGTEEVAFPTIKLSDLSQNDRLSDGSLADYFGVQTFPSDEEYSGSELVSALPFRAYQLIYNQYYRDQNLEEELDVQADTNGILTTQQALEISRWRWRAWQKDYFTSALPWAQRGPAVTLPLTGTAPIVDAGGNAPGLRGVRRYPESGHDTRVQTIWSPNTVEAGYQDVEWNENVDPYIVDNGGAGGKALGRLEGGVIADSDTILSSDINIDLNSTNQVNLNDLFADLSHVSATTINELRKASRLQEWFEKNARGGARYIEQIFSHFGVKSSDSRLQRAEFLGGQVVPIITTDVLQTSASEDSSALANYAGTGGAMASTRKVKKFFEEHGYVVALLSIRPKPSYMQGIKKDLTKFDRFDFGWPEFAQLGEQPILNKELFFALNDSGNDDVFGYTPRYAEYKFLPNTIHGDFRNSLNYWHLSRIFSTAPNLSSNFVHVSENRDELSRIFAVETELGDNLDHFWLNIQHNIRAVRCLPKYGIPVL